MAVSNRREVDNAQHDLNITKQTVEIAENRARLQVKTSKLLRGNDRQYAQALHRQADDLCQRGEYESALVLYHRAATMCPHDSSHSAAARRTTATISSWNNPEKSLANFPTNVRDEAAIFRVASCSENAALGICDASSSNNLSIVPDILRYLEARKRPSRGNSTAMRSITSHNHSKTILHHMNSRADRMLKSLRTNFNAGKMRSSLRLAEDLLTLSSSLEDPRRYSIPTYHYLSLIHMTMGRHDRACSTIAAMVRLSMSTNDTVLLSRALMTLGKVHLSFGHLEAAARAWENLSVHIEHLIPRAWIHHEIGRCYLERGRYSRALRKAAQCRECADEANSKRWIFHASLLRAQCLAMLGRFAEALEELRTAANISEEEGDTPTVSYIRDLIDQLNRALREIAFGEDRCLKGASRRLSSRSHEESGRSEGNGAITTSGIRKATRSKGDDTLLPSFYCDYLHDEILDRRQRDEESSSLDSAVSFRSKQTNLTYVIDSCTDVSSREKSDAVRTDDDYELAELLSHESHTTFKTCYIESKHQLPSQEGTSYFSKQPIVETCVSNVETGIKRASDTFRMTHSRSCEDGWCSFDGVIDRASHDTIIAQISQGCSLLPEAVQQKDEEDEEEDDETFVSETFSSPEIPV